ncbi:MAG: F0F1 ATP synthase subunit B [Fusobacteriaceae bacterium]
MVQTNMPAVSIDINMFWQIINFIVLMFMFNKYLKAPLAKILTDRKNTIVNDLEQAQEAKKSAETLKKEMEEVLKKSRIEANELIANAERKAQERYEALVKEGHSHRDKIIKSAELETVKMRDDLKKELTQSLRETAALMAMEVLNKKMDETEKNSLLDEFIDEVGEVKW